MSDPNTTTPLLPRSANEPQPQPQTDSHPITLRVCHSPWKPISQHVLAVLRLLLSGYLISVFGVSLKYKLDQKDDHTGWRIPFQFSTVSFVLLTLYHLQATLWTIMHIYVPHELDEDPAECRGHHVRNRIINMLTPSSRNEYCSHKYRFSMFYTTAHVFTFMNTIIYWAVLVPSGHGGFKPPQMPHHHHTPGNATSAASDPDKGLFDDGTIKSFSIINVWSITSVIGLIEIFLLNSIRRQRPISGHVAGISLASVAYLVWSCLGKALTGHAGLFFIDPELMGDLKGAAVAAGLLFVLLSSGVFAYTYGLIAMRESLSAHNHH